MHVGVGGWVDVGVVSHLERALPYCLCQANKDLFIPSWVELQQQKNSGMCSNEGTLGCHLVTTLHYVLLVCMCVYACHWVWETTFRLG